MFSSFFMFSVCFLISTALSTMPWDTRLRHSLFKLSQRTGKYAFSVWTPTACAARHQWEADLVALPLFFLFPLIRHHMRKYFRIIVLMLVALPLFFLFPLIRHHMRKYFRIIVLMLVALPLFFLFPILHPDPRRPLPLQGNQHLGIHLALGHQAPHLGEVVPPPPKRFESFQRANTMFSGLNTPGALFFSQLLVPAPFPDPRPRLRPRPPPATPTASHPRGTCRR